MSARDAITRESALMEPDDGVTRDLMQKVSDDVAGVLLRMIAIAPPPRLPIFLSAAAVVLGMMAAELDNLSESTTSEPTPELIMLAALLAGHSGIDQADPAKGAYKDLAILKSAGRIPNATADGRQP